MISLPKSDRIRHVASLILDYGLQTVCCSWCCHVLWYWWVFLDDPWSMGLCSECSVQVVTIRMIEELLERKWHNWNLCHQKHICQLNTKEKAAKGNRDKFRSSGKLENSFVPKPNPSAVFNLREWNNPNFKTTTPLNKFS